MTTLQACLSFALSALLVAPAAAAPQLVIFSGDVPAGTIVVRTAERQLYLVLNGQTALRYPVAVGRAGRVFRPLRASL